MIQLCIGRGLLMIAATLCAFALSLLTLGDARAASTGPTVAVNVDAVDADNPGNPLMYQWRSTDGQIVDSGDPLKPSTEWILPAGGGKHFAYVLVSNCKGGYTETRIEVNTDSLGIPLVPSPPVDLTPPPPSTIPFVVPFRGWLGGGLGSYILGGEGRFGTMGGVGILSKIALPDIPVTASNLSRQQESSMTSLSGDFTFQTFAPTTLFEITCKVGSLEFPCLGGLGGLDDVRVDVEANQTNRIDLVPTKTSDEQIIWVTGRALLEDGSACGTENAFFGVSKTATAELVDNISLRTIPGTTVNANSWGQFSIPVSANLDRAQTQTTVSCEDASVITSTSGTEIPALTSGTDKSIDVGIMPIVGSRPPIVRSMSVTPATITQKFASAIPAPHDVVPLRPAKFLAMKGLDTRLSGCLYYKTIGAVRDCDPSKANFLVNAVSFDDWKRTVKIDQYVQPGAQQYRAVFVNKVDLNLTRDHHSVSYGPNATAGYVCNYPGPDPTISDPMAHQNDVDQKIEDAIHGKNLVACVAMDHSVATGVNFGAPFTRFLIFGPSGELLPSVNLDELGEKFVPGTCVVCHGGNKYAGKFPKDRTEAASLADLEAHFLPFDIGSFEFHSGKGGITITIQQGSTHGLRQEDQEADIFHLNQNLLNTKINQAEKELINGWYPKKGPPQNKDFIPLSVVKDDGTLKPNFNLNFYKNVIAKSCRTCHIAQRDQDSIRDLNFAGPPEVNVGKAGVLSPPILAELVCGQTDDLVRAYAMPNSKVTFDLFWKSNQPEILTYWLAKAPFGTTHIPCSNPKAP